MMHTVDITVSDVDPDGPEGETVLFSRAMDGNGRAQHTDCWAEVSAAGEESRDEGLEEKEWGDIGLASGEKPPCCSTGVGMRLRFSPSPDKCWWRALRRTKSLVARGPRGSYRGVTTSRLATPGPGDSVVMLVVMPGVSPGLGDLRLGEGTLVPSSEVPRTLMGAWRVRKSGSPSRGEAKRCVSIRAEKRLRAPRGGLASPSIYRDSEQDKRFLQLLWSVSKERHTANQELIEDDTHGPPIHRLSIALTENHLWSDVLWGPTYLWSAPSSSLSSLLQQHQQLALTLVLYRVSGQPQLADDVPRDVCFHQLSLLGVVLRCLQQ
ncbi:hypothetical protein INR49_030956, partial [Caranx melampygus]